MNAHRLLTTLLVVLAATGPAAGGPAWRVETALEAPVGLDGCAVGDVLPDRPGHEIVASAMDGSIYVVRRDGDGWTHERAAKFAGEMIQCAVGDADPAHDGDEIVAVGMVEGREGPGKGAVHLVRRTAEGTWATETLFVDDGLVHGVCIGDLDPGRDGNEVLVVGFSGRATLLARGDDGGWTAETAAELEGNGKNAVMVGDTAAVGTSAGVLLALARARRGGWESDVLDRAPAGQSRLASDGTRILSARDDGVLALIGPDGRAEIHREERKLRGAVLADLDPRHPGLEAATCGYSGLLTVLREIDGAWVAEPVHRDTDSLHHLAAGKLPGGGPGVDLVACGHSGRLLVASSR